MQDRGGIPVRRNELGGFQDRMSDKPVRPSCAVGW